MSSLTRCLLPLTLMLLLAGCGSTPSQPSSEAAGADAVSFSEITQPSSVYLAKAGQGKDEQAMAYRLLAVAAMLGEGQTNAAATLYRQLPTSWSSASARGLAMLIEAELAVMAGDNDQALRKLTAVPVRELGQPLQQRHASLLADVYEAKGESLAAARQLDLAAYLSSDSGSRQQLHDRLWQVLATIPPFTLTSAATAPPPNRFSGWLRLAAAHQEAQQDPKPYAARLTQLREQYPEHPAFTQPPAPLAVVLGMTDKLPQRIAVLLPLSGRNQALGEAVRDGLAQAYLQGVAGKGVVQFIDTANGMDKALAAITASKAELIIGPLLKADVETLLANPPQIPWIALNRVAGNWPATSLQFALAPEDEAEQTAERMTNDGIRQPLLLTPNSSVGERISSAFSQRWQQLVGEGKQPMIATYGDRQQVQQAVAKALGLTASQARVNQLQQVTGLELEAEPRSRRDIDAIYLYANAADARFIKPSLESALSSSASRPPLYLSASAHDLGTGNQELAGALVSDMPLLLPGNEHERNSLQLHRATWPQRGVQEIRLFALGHDALLLVPSFSYLSAFPGYEVRGLSGGLRAHEGVIHRNVEWAKMTKDKVERVASGNH